MRLVAMRPSYAFGTLQPHNVYVTLRAIVTRPREGRSSRVYLA